MATRPAQPPVRRQCLLKVNLRNRSYQSRIDLPKVVLGASFTDGLEVATADPQAKAAA
jgi:hypothetical protein